jgi:hypothetical protein
MRVATFKQLYGANAFGKCVSNAVKSANANTTAALNTCKAAQLADKTAFKAKYPSFGKCVSATANTANQVHQAATIAAAKSCKTEQTAGAAAFTAKYGTGASKANAFGKCVAAQARATP